MMKKERIKNVVLIALVISSLVLTGQIWFNEKLWPEGYNFFVDIKTSTVEKISDVFGLKKQKDSSVRTSVASPVYIAAYMVKDFDHAITMLDTTHKHYELVNDYISSVLSNAMACDAKNVIKVSEEDWKKALFTRGFYVDYGARYTPPTFAQLFGVYTSEFSQMLSSVKSFIITTQDSVVSDVSVYVSDEISGGFYRISTGFDKNEFNAKLALLSDDATPKKRFSFFINADVSTGVAGEAVFAPYLILNEESMQRKIIKASNPILHDNSIAVSMYTIEKLLKIFSINPKTAIKYTDADGNIIFVQSKNTLKISNDGVLSYTTVSGGKGPKMQKNRDGIGNAEVISSAVELVGEVYNTLVGNDSVRIYLSDLDEKQSTVKAFLNYMQDGVPIVLGGVYDGKNAVEIEFEQGYLKSYYHVLREYEVTEKISITEPTYNAKIFDALSNEEKMNGIDKLFEAYNDDGTDGEKSSSWFVKIKDTDLYKR